MNNENHPEEEKQAGRQAEDWSTVNMKLTWDTRKTTDQHMIK